ncbi:MAG: hypothetical protein JO103_14420 [Candidatus Eremiobacteraeota bacterium]|nr:hypothetical protein [Candidatus Eremiobacteraeota bacterium]
MTKDVLTFHGDNLRTGWFRGETTLTPTNVRASFGPLLTFRFPGKVYAQPLFVSGETVANGTTRDLVLIATAADQLYAVDGTTNALVWKRSFTNPPSVVQQSWVDTNCMDVNPDVGIVGTPVVDRALDRLFVVVPTRETASGATTYHLRLHAISLKNGADAVSPVEVTGQTGSQQVSPLNNFQRAGLLEANGNVYVALASHCDKQTTVTHGWLLAYNATTLAQTGNLLNTTRTNPQNYFLGSPWMAGFAPAADAQGNIYFVTGNGPFNGSTSFAMSVMKVPPNLDISKATSFTPGTWAQDSSEDDDLASGGAMLLPDQSGAYAHLLVTGGKCRNYGDGPCLKYVLNRDRLGGAQATPSPYPNGTQPPAPALWQADTAGGMWGGPAYFATTSGQYVLYGGGLNGYSYMNPMLSTYALSASPVGLRLLNSASYANGCLECRSGGSQPVVSSNGMQPGTAVVWVVQTPGGAGGTITLYAFNPATMATLYQGAAGQWLKGPGTTYQGGAMVSPLVANGKVYVPAQEQVTVFGLRGAALAGTKPSTITLAPPTVTFVARVRGHAAAPHHVLGRIVALTGARFTLRTRAGALLQVDASEAIRSGDFSAPLFVGKPVLVTGTRVGSVFHAVSVSRADSLQGGPDS